MKRQHKHRENSPRPRTADAYRLRIIGGSWRGTRLGFPHLPGIRPTPDRIRETLFNWLAPRIAGARCLDLFAGSGALGLEALSRGARETVFVDREPAVATYLRETLGRLKCDRAHVHAMDALAFINGGDGLFDVVFLDPPFAAGLLPAMCRQLTEANWLAPDARVYLENPVEEGVPALPVGWNVVRTGAAGKVGYHLAAVTLPAPATEPPATEQHDHRDVSGHV